MRETVFLHGFEALSLHSVFINGIDEFCDRAEHTISQNRKISICGGFLLNTYVTENNLAKRKKAARDGSRDTAFVHSGSPLRVTAWIMTLTLSAYLLTHPALAPAALSDSLTLCFKALFPSLFPFMIAGELLIASGFPEACEKIFGGIFRRIFKINGRGSSAFVIGAFCGFPLGAKAAVSLYLAGDIEKSDAEALSGICNNAGVGFVISGIGGSVWRSARLGILLYVSQLISAALTGFILLGARKKHNEGAPESSFKAPPKRDFSLSEALSGAVSSSVSAILRVAGFVIFFKILLSALTEALSAAGVGALTVSLISAFTEISAGANALHSLAVSSPVLSDTAKILTFAASAFGGLSVYMQFCAIAYPAGVKTGAYLKAKLVQSAISAAFGTAAVLLRMV